MWRTAGIVVPADKNYMESPAEERRNLQGDMLVMRPEELLLGMYVDLNCSWFRHPFPRKTFKITSQSQLATIKGLGLSSVLVDPRQSNPGTCPGSPAISPRPELSPPPAASEELIPAADTALPAAADYCETVHLAGQTYLQILKRGHHIIKQVGAGSEEGVSGAKAMINALSTLIMHSTHSNTIASLFTAAAGDNVGVLHALNVCTLSMIIARRLELSLEEIRFIGMAGLLHDVGEQRLPLRILRHHNRLSKTDIQELQRHPQYSVDILERFPQFPTAVLDIIKCHHERLDGSGYPLRLKGAQLSLPARIVMVVEEYDSLVHKQGEGSTLTPSEAMGHIYAKAKILYPEEVVVALVQTLSVFPPGSIVELSDGSVGLVLSLNVESRMRPMVLLYEAAPAKDRPRVRDLAQEPGCSIVRALPKQRLSPDMASYLNFHRWTGYFIESSLKTFQDSSVV